MACPFDNMYTDSDEDFFSSYTNEISDLSPNKNFDNYQIKDDSLVQSDFLIPETSENLSKSCPCSETSQPKEKNFFKSITKLLKKFGEKEDIYKAISLYEFYLIIILIIFIFSTQNTYFAVLFLALLSKQIPERIIKTFLSYDYKDGSQQLTEWAKRPEGAMNCNMLNSGGPAINSGLISGHTFLISTVAFYFIYKFTDNLKHNANYKQGLFITVLFVWIALVTMARIGLNCHQKHQTLIGIIGGMIWGYLVYYILEQIVNVSERVKEDQDKFLKMFDI